jgi:hypothetical protein
MSTPTVRANARAMPEATKPTPTAPASPEAAPRDEYIRAWAEHQSEEICRLFLLVDHVEDMAEALVKTYDAGFQSGAQSSEGA